MQTIRRLTSGPAGMWLLAWVTVVFVCAFNVPRAEGVPPPLSEEELREKSDVVATVRVLGVACIDVKRHTSRGPEGEEMTVDLGEYQAWLQVTEVEEGNVKPYQTLVVRWQKNPPMPGSVCVPYYPGEVVHTYLQQRGKRVTYRTTHWNAKGEPEVERSGGLPDKRAGAVAFAQQPWDKETEERSSSGSPSPNNKEGAEEDRASVALPRVKKLTCREHAALDGNRPPHENCWGHYRRHTYPINDLLGEGKPVKVMAVAGTVTGGESELNKMVDGFSVRTPKSPTDRWETLTSFAAPCASAGPGALFCWNSSRHSDRPDQEMSRLQIKAPAGHVVDSSTIWVMYRPNGENTGEAENGLPEPLRLGESDDQAEVTVVAGQKLMIRLESNPTTGFRWSVSDVDQNILRVIDQKYEPAEEDSGKLGSGGHTTFTFQAKGTGETGLELEYSRPWEGAKKRQRTFSLTVNVTPSDDAERAK
ncbi:MAG: protease inhibitor I42 family protein [Planctomycetota bacterium]